MSPVRKEKYPDVSKGIVLKQDILSKGNVLKLIN